MTIVLGGITLNPDMIWLEQFTSQKVAQSSRRTLGGAPVIFSGALEKGAPFTLLATEANGKLIGILKKSVVDSLLALADVVGATYVLAFNGVNYSVMFRHEEPPAVAMVPLKAWVSYTANDLMRGEIRLLTV